jgi:hypothetical protein
MTFLRNMTFPFATLGHGHWERDSAALVEFVVVEGQLGDHGGVSENLLEAH